MPECPANKAVLASALNKILNSDDASLTDLIPTLKIIAEAADSMTVAFEGKALLMHEVLSHKDKFLFRAGQELFVVMRSRVGLFPFAEYTARNFPKCFIVSYKKYSSGHLLILYCARAVLRKEKKKETGSHERRFDLHVRVPAIEKSEFSILNEFLEKVGLTKY